MLEKVLGDVVSRCWSYLIAMSSHTGVGVDGLACLVHRPMAYSRQTRGLGFLPCAVLSHHAAMGDGALLEDTQPPGLGIHGGV
jgi:hypothetical protein